MKARKIFKKTGIISLIVTTVLFLQSFSVITASRNEDPAVVSFEVNYVGADAQYLFFEMIVLNADSSKEASLRINIVANGQDDIFDERYVLNNKKRIFKIAKEDIDQLSFCIVSKRKTSYYYFIVERVFNEQLSVVSSGLS